MQLGEIGLIAVALQLCVARHAHKHLPRHKHTQGCALSSDVDCRLETVSTRTTTSLLFLEADVNIQYQEVFTTTSAARRVIGTALGNQYREGPQPTNFHHQPQTLLPSQGWTERNGTHSIWRFDNYSTRVHRPMFEHITASPLIHSVLKPSTVTASPGGSPGSQGSFSSSGSHRKQRASRFAVLTTILILMGGALFIGSQ